MRILTWNINGVRTLPQYHPWNTLKTFDDILNHLEADIICFQEMKSSRQALPKQVALPASYDSFFSFPVRKTGYSGVATYTRKTTITPLKAEEGLTGLVQPRPPLSDAERISRLESYPPELSNPNAEETVDYKDLDSEGRAVIIDFGLFVLINLYCPNDSGTDEREKFKMQYHRMLEARVQGFIREGREVIVLGDLNACTAVDDHCEGHLMVARGLAEGLQGEEGFWGKEYRRWIRDWLIQEDGSGCLVDIVRKFWPDRKGMYTCWNTKISARESNYGTRIDFILITPGLVPWVKAADIQPEIKGSDHCPVFIDLQDEITNADGTITKLSDLLKAPFASQPVELPRLAAKYWDEHKQKLLSSFFGKKSEDAIPLSTPSQTPTPPSFIDAAGSIPSQSSTVPASASSSVSDVMQIDKPPLRASSTQTFDDAPESSSMTSTAKRKLTADNGSFLSSSTKKAKISASTLRKSASGSGKFKPDEMSARSSSTVNSNDSKPAWPPVRSASKRKGKETEKDEESVPAPAIERSTTDPVISSSPSPIKNSQVDETADFQFALSLSQEDGSQRASSSPSKKDSKQAWSTLLAPTITPKCTVHGELTKEYTVNKLGPNKGKKFFICSRPVGPGYDKGFSERPREQVDPQYRCNFFKWSSEVRREMKRNGSS